MDLLGLIIFIGFILIKVLGKLPDLKDKIPKEWEQENWPKDWKLPWEEELGGESTIEERTVGERPLERAATKTRTEENRASHNKALDYEKIHWEGPPIEDEVEEIEVLGDENITLEQHPLFNSQSLVNGIIISEILQPPKARRNN